MASTSIPHVGIIIIIIILLSTQYNCYHYFRITMLSILFYNSAHTSNPIIEQIEGTLDLKSANKVSALCMLHKSCSYCIPSVQWYHVLCTLSIHLIWGAAEVTGNNQIVAVPPIANYSNQFWQFWILMNDMWQVTCDIHLLLTNTLCVDRLSTNWLDTASLQEESAYVGSPFESLDVKNFSWSICQLNGINAHYKLERDHVILMIGTLIMSNSNWNSKPWLTCFQNSPRLPILWPTCL